MGTNDGFAAAKGVSLAAAEQLGGAPLIAYDAGVEVNTEACGDVPICGSGNLCNWFIWIVHIIVSFFLYLIQAPTPGEGFVHVHRGIHGVAGADGLDAATYDWRNPVATLTIMPQERYWERNMWGAGGGAGFGNPMNNGFGNPMNNGFGNQMGGFGGKGAFGNQGFGGKGAFGDPGFGGKGAFGDPGFGAGYGGAGFGNNAFARNGQRSPINTFSNDDQRNQGNQGNQARHWSPDLTLIQ